MWKFLNFKACETCSTSVSVCLSRAVLSFGVACMDDKTSMRT